MRAFAITVGLMLLPGGALVADEAPRRLIERAIAAHGGYERLASARAERLRLKGTLHAGAGSAPFTSDQAVELPGRYRSVVRVTQGANTHTVVHAIDGDKAAVWIDGRSMPVAATHRAQLLQALQLHQAMKLVTLLSDPSFTLRPLGQSTVNGRAAVGLRVSGKLQRDLAVYFDRETALLVKTDLLVDGPGGKDVRQETYYSDHREMGGHRRPAKVVVYRDGKKVMEAEVVEARPVEGIDPEELARP
jgi:hypothetical protein